MLWRRLIATFTLAFLFALGVSSASLAAELGPGARAMGMAGAYVAVADDGTAAYWNPAGITQLRILGITPSLGAVGDWMELQTSIGDDFPPNLGNTGLEINGMLGALFRGFGVSLLMTTEANTSYQQTNDETTSTGEIQALGTGQITVAHRFGVLALGVNLKGFYGQGLSFTANKNENPNNPSALGEYRESLGTGYGIDLGALFKVGEILRVGVNLENLSANINWEETPYTYVIDPNTGNGDWVKGTTSTRTDKLPAVAHVGLAVKPPLIGTLIAAQADIPLGNEGTANYRIGFEQSLLFFKLRAGAILDADLAVANFTGGLGLKLGPVLLDVAAVADPGLALEGAVLTAGFSF